MVRLYQSWHKNIPETKAQFAELHQTLTKDASITKEYFGINSYFVAVDESNSSAGSQCFDQYLTMLEGSLQMGNQLCVLMLEMLNDSQKGLHGSTQASRLGLSAREVVESAQ